MEPRYGHTVLRVKYDQIDELWNCFGGLILGARSTQITVPTFPIERMNL
jgi:hypothetical protein